MEELLFGPAGIPHAAKSGDMLGAIKKIKELGLDCMEIEFTYGVWMKRELALKVGEAREREKIALTVHAPYYINLNSKEKQKVGASRARILQSAEMGFLCGAKSLTFHAAFYMGKSPKEAMDAVEAQLNKILEEMHKKGIKITLAPETTGKASQFGTLEELQELAGRMNGVRFCLDFSHLHARANGLFRKKEDLEKTVDGIEKKYLHGLHMHVSGINYSAKGERNHLNLQDAGNDFNYKWLMEVLKEKRVSGTIACESPNLEEDAMLLKKYYKSI